MTYIVGLIMLIMSIGAWTPIFAAEPMPQESTTGKPSNQAMRPEAPPRDSICQASQGVQQTATDSNASDKSRAGHQQQASAGSGSPAEGQMVKGKFAGMEGENYVIKDQGGKDLCIRTTYSTFLDQTFVPGDTIFARMAPDGTAAVIGRVIDTQTAGGSPPSGMLSEAAAPNASAVKGELLKIQDEFYTVKDPSGNEVRLHVNKDTKLDGTFNVGDRIEAERTTSGHALSIRKASEGRGTGDSNTPSR